MPFYLVSAPGHKWEKQVDAVLGIAASVLLGGMTLLTFVDVLARYLFNRPIRGGFEVTELMLLVLIYAGLPLVSHADEHVTMDFIDRLLPDWLVRAWVRVMHAIIAGLMLFLAWQAWIKAGKIAGYGDTTDVLRILVGPFVYFMTAMLALTAVVHVFKIFSPGRGAAQQGTT